MNPSVPGSDPFVTFCREVIPRYATNWPPSEHRLAEDFVRHFSVGRLFRFEEVAQLCAKFEIDFSSASLPEGLRGHNSYYQGRRAITLSDQEPIPGSREHTALHELRELLEYTFRDLGYPTVAGENLEEHAERFAIETRIASASELWKELVETARQSESKWRRRAALFFIVLLGLAHAFGCVLLPHFEDKLQTHK